MLQNRPLRKTKPYHCNTDAARQRTNAVHPSKPTKPTKPIIPLACENDEGSVVIYYQTTVPISALCEQQAVPLSAMVIYLSSFHFFKDDEGIIKLYLNDDVPENQQQVLSNMKELQLKGARVMMMLGGAGGAYGVLFEEYDACVSVLFDFLRANLWISGIDLDVEENVGLDNVCRLISTLTLSVGHTFAITMAPVESAMIADVPGLGGFSYTELCKRSEGRRINWFNVQCYEAYDSATFRSIMENGHDPERIVLGMLGDAFDDAAFTKAMQALYATCVAYPKLRGAALWEFGDTRIPPVAFAEGVYGAFHSWAVSTLRVARLVGGMLYAASFGKDTGIRRLSNVT
jgi:hypothetical protein